ncbi:hypothetical protein T12_1239, partial [Trichinella patagoniensis]
MESPLGWILSGPIATNADEGVVMFSEIETENGLRIHDTNSFLKDSIH